MYNNNNGNNYNGGNNYGGGSQGGVPKKKDGAIWAKQMKNGNAYFSISIDGVGKFVAFPNTFKNKDNQPDFNIFKSENQQGQQQMQKQTFNKPQNQGNNYNNNQGNGYGTQNQQGGYQQGNQQGGYQNQQGQQQGNQNFNVEQSGYEKADDNDIDKLNLF